MVCVLYFFGSEDIVDHLVALKDLRVARGEVLVHGLDLIDKISHILALANSDSMLRTLLVLQDKQVCLLQFHSLTL